MSWITAIIGGIFGPLFGAISNWLTARRTDQNAKELGETKAKLRNAVAGQQEVAEATSARATMADSLTDDERVREPDAHTRPGD